MVVIVLAVSVSLYLAVAFLVFAGKSLDDYGVPISVSYAVLWPKTLYRALQQVWRDT